MNDLQETFTLVNGYDKRKTRETATFRKFTLTDIAGILATGQTHFYFIDKRGEYRQCRRNGQVKTWKRDPLRFECSFSYGMYEHFRMNTQEMLDNLVVRL